MGQVDGFMKYERENPKSRDTKQRIKDYKEIYNPMDKETLHHNAARCMDCGVPFCHNGCPLGNNIPDFNDAVYNGKWEEAIRILSSTNNFPEFTGRICPAPCEASCVLSINNKAVTIEYIEKTIGEVAFEKGYIKANPPKTRTGKKVAVVGSGPAGLSAAAQLNKAGHLVTVFERADRPGGLLMYGIPNMKLDKGVVQRRIDLLAAEGVRFVTSADVGNHHAWLQLQRIQEKVGTFFLLPFLAFEPWRSLPPHDLCDLATQVAFADAVGAGHSSDVR